MKLLVSAKVSTLVGSCSGSVKQATEAFDAKATDEQSFFGIAEELQGPGREATIVDRLPAGSASIAGDSVAYMDRVIVFLRKKV